MTQYELHQDDRQVRTFPTREAAKAALAEVVADGGYLADTYITEETEEAK